VKQVIFHIDMDAFYASVEQSDHPELRGQPVIVGGTTNRGVVSAASYEAREFGVHSAMPIFQARQKCPQGHFLPVRMERYQQVSRIVMGILYNFSPLVEQVSIDEAYLDLSGMERLMGPPREIGIKIKTLIRKETSLSCSVGIAPNRFLAKIASEMEKPDGLTIIHQETMQYFIDHLSIEKVPGVGEKSLKQLNSLNIKQLGDVRRLNEKWFVQKIGKLGERLIDLSKGIDKTPVKSQTKAKSVSSENTLSKDTNDIELLKDLILVQSEIVGRRLRDKGLWGSTVTLKLKTAGFKLITRSHTIDEPTNSSNAIYEQGVKLLRHMDLAQKYRLIGIGVSNVNSMDEEPRQQTLFPAESQSEESWLRVEKALDRIKDKFGRNAIKRARLIK
jgi:DNA polymerase-4